MLDSASTLARRMVSSSALSLSALEGEVEDGEGADLAGVELREPSPLPGDKEGRRGEEEGGGGLGFLAPRPLRGGGLGRRAVAGR